MRSQVVAALAAVVLLGAGSAPAPSPVQTVRTWYAVIGPGSGSAVGFGYGTLGGSRPYYQGYAMLAAAFRAKESVAGFVAGFARTAYIRLDQAELVDVDSKNAVVFVEDERDMDLEGLPSTVRYFGRIRLTRVSGAWRIAGLELSPEKSIISLRDGGHGSEGSISDVALVAVAGYYHAGPDTPRRRWVASGIDSRFFSSTFALQYQHSPVTLVYDGPRGRLVVELVRLYSGQYLPLAVHR